MQLGLSLPDKRPEALPKAVAALGTLISYLESADAAPTKDMNSASDIWLANCDQAVERWQAFLKRDLPAANRQLQKASQEPLSVTATTDVEGAKPQ
jgi:hypothetical protein